MTIARFALATAAIVLGATSAQAQTTENSGSRWRVTAGAQIVPDYPGADGHSIQPLFGLSHAKAGQEFDFSAADQSFGFSLLRADGFSAGPSLSYQGKRSRSDTGNLLPRVKATVEVGGFAQYQFSNFRLRGEVRQGIGGHKGLVGTVSADFVARDGDNWLFSFGPRLNLSDKDYQRAYFGVPVAVPAAGLPLYRPDGGVHSYGVGATALYSLTPRIGLSGYAKYDRLVGDAGRSPVVRQLGDRNQLSGGLALTYTFGG
jgi:outer membrane protein